MTGNFIASYMLFSLIALVYPSDGRTVQGIKGRNVSLSWTCRDMNDFAILHGSTAVVWVLPSQNRFVIRNKQDRLQFIADKCANNTVKYTIDIMNVTENDAGNYKVQRLWDSEKFSDSIVLEIIAPPRITMVQHVSLDSSIQLQCTYLHMFTGKISWKLNESIIDSHDRYSQNNSLLSIKNFTADDKYNIYKCNEYGSGLDSDPYLLNISGPNVVKFVSNITVAKEHVGLNLFCDADCYPTCTWNWTKLDLLSTSKKVISAYKELQINNVTRKDAGKYLCKVYNIITGTSLEGSTYLEVVYGPDEIYTNISNNIIQVIEYETISVSCYADCFPPCQIGWMETNTNIPIHGAVLKLETMTVNVNYTCYATNSMNSNASNSRMISIKVTPDETLIPTIAIIRLFSSSVVLQCRSSCVSTGTFLWRVNGFPIENSDKYSENSHVLTVRNLTVDDQKNSYTCRKPGTNFQSNPFRIKIYGPDKVVIKTSKNGNGVYQLACSADCFPLCQFRWTSSYTDKIIEGAELKLDNVKSDITVTCHATNPITMNAKVSATIDVMVKSEDIHHMTSPKYQDQNREIDSMHIPSTEYVVYIILGTAGTGLIVGVLLCLLKKHILCPGLFGVSNNNDNVHSDIDGSNEEATLSQLYWTIGSDTRGAFSTVLERDNNVELVEFIEPAHIYLVQSEKDINGIHQNLETFKAHADPLHSGALKMQSPYLDSAESGENIDPIPPIRLRNSEDFDLISSDPVECNDYIHPIHSDPMDVEGYIDPIHSHSMKMNEYLDLIPPDPVHYNHYIYPVTSDSLDLDGYLNPTSSSFRESDRSVDLIISHPGEDHDPIPSGIMESDMYIHTIYTDPVEIDEYIDSSHSDDMESDIYIDTISSDPVDIDVCIDSSHSDDMEHDVYIHSSIVYSPEPDK